MLFSIIRFFILGEASWQLTPPPNNAELFLIIKFDIVGLEL